LLAAPYVSDYDLVMAGLVPPWLAEARRPRTDDSSIVRLSSVMLVVAPLAAAPLAKLTGVAAAGALLLPALGLALASGCLPPRRGRSGVALWRTSGG
ncbi:MAG: hypothetical protein M3Y41_21370, partial [Pseudomonadota bacterium]|nr:hypothetical protein [Pseudomonadota bacterium]